MVGSKQATNHSHTNDDRVQLRIYIYIFCYSHRFKFRCHGFHDTVWSYIRGSIRTFLCGENNEAHSSIVCKFKTENSKNTF